MKELFNEIFYLLEEKHPWSTPYLIFNYNQFPKHLNNPLIGNFTVFKNLIFFLRNIDKFTIEKPQLYNPQDLLKCYNVGDFDIPNLKNITPSDVDLFTPIQISTWKGKVNYILDGRHRTLIASKLNTPIKAIEYKSHSYNSHPNNNKIMKLANLIWDKTKTTGEG